MHLTFHGGARMVTGANYLLEAGDKRQGIGGKKQGTRILIDCGLMQGSHYAERQNFEPFPYDPKTIDAVFVTHAHIDHIGRIPKLARDGFRGTIYSTEPTRDFAELLLLDSEHIMAQEAARERRPPICGALDVECAMKQWRGLPYHEPVRVGPFTVEFHDAGHILGSAFIKVTTEGKTIVFSGDLGNYPAPIIRPTEFVEEADYCIVESTYGDKIHEDEDKRQELLEDAVEDTVRLGGTLMIPAFAMERTQDLLYYLNQLAEGRRIPTTPIFVDSPLAIHLTEVYKKHLAYWNEDSRAKMRSGDDILNFPGLRLTLTTEQSKEINDVPPPKVIIAGSGMSHGGRILHHERRYLPDPKSTILFIGYQATGSLGRRILDGADEVTIFGETVPVRARRRAIGGYSAHADQPRLMRWLSPMRHSLKRVFVVQGEPEASAALRQRIRDDLAVEAVVPELHEAVVL